MRSLFLFLLCFLVAFHNVMAQLAKQVDICIYGGTSAGQTSGEWVHLGDYHFAAKGKPWIEISNKDAHGMVVADAVLLKQK